MSFIEVELVYKKFNNLKFLEKIKYVNQNEYFVFERSDCFLCLHIDSIQRVIDFKKYSKIRKRINYPDYLKYIDPISYNFKFNNKFLVKESSFKIDQSLENQHFENHNDCSICYQNFVRKEIRKRKKLETSEMCNIAYDLGANYTLSKITKEYDLSKTSISKF